MKLGSAPYRAVNRLFSVGVEVIFIAADFSGLGSDQPGQVIPESHKAFATSVGLVGACGWPFGKECQQIYPLFSDPQRSEQEHAYFVPHQSYDLL